MMKYEYVRVKMKKDWLSLSLTGHRGVINSYAKMGYRYAGYLPVKQTNLLLELDLIFEKEADEDAKVDSPRLRFPFSGAGGESGVE